MNTKHKKRIYERIIKRLLDIICAFLFIAVFCWLYIILIVLVRLKLGSPVLFKQDRPGKNEKIFKLYKFRSMTDDRDEEGNLLPDERRLTKFGEWLRSTSLDELPEVFNILKGDMSIVGPRPLLVKYLPLYNEYQKKRHTIRPGLTGLAQINGRNELSWEEKFTYDVQYADNVTFSGDLKIIIQTVIKVLKHEGINAEGSATIDEFQGTPKEETRL